MIGEFEVMAATMRKLRAQTNQAMRKYRYAGSGRTGEQEPLHYVVGAESN